MASDLYRRGIVQVKAYRLLQDRVATVVRSFEFGSVSEWFVLNHICNEPEVLAKDVAALLDVEAPLITRLVNNLVSRGLVRITPGAKDKRVKLLSPTEKAGALVPWVEAAIEKSLAGLLEGLSVADLQAYAAVLDAIIVNAERQSPARQQ
jgi:DNA-binding MarR family transcriptional regulator